MRQRHRLPAKGTASPDNSRTRWEEAARGIHKAHHSLSYLELAVTSPTTRPPETLPYFISPLSTPPIPVVLTFDPEGLHVGLQLDIFQPYTQHGQQEDAGEHDLAGMALHHPARVEQVELSPRAHPQGRSAPTGLPLRTERRGLVRTQ